MINRRQLLGGAASLGLIALFRSKRVPSMLVELPDEITEDQIVEEYEAYPSAIDMVVMTMTAFRPRRLVVPEAIGPLWTVENILVGKQSQFAAPDQPIPAEVFSVGAVDMELGRDSAPGGVEIRMRVRRSGPVNLKAPPETFHAAFFGEVVEAGVDGEAKTVYEGGAPKLEDVLRYGSRPRMMALPISSNPYQVIP